MVYEDIARKLLQRYWRLSRGLTLGVRAVVFDGDARVLLVRHTYTRGWHFPGGGVEFRETVYDALARELEEEAGVSIAGQVPELFGLYANGARFPGDHVALFLVRAWERRHVFAPNREIAAAEFFDQNALPEDTNAATLRRLDEIAGRQARQAGW